MTSKLSDFLSPISKGVTKASVITVNKGDTIPCDGTVIDGFAMVDEAAIAGVSAPAMIEAAPGRDQVLAGTIVVEGSLTIQCNQKQGK